MGESLGACGAGGASCGRVFLLGGGRFSVPLAPLATALVRGPAAAFGLRFPVNHVAGRCEEEYLRRWEQLLKAGVVNGSDLPVAKKLDSCDLVGKAGVAGP